MSLGRILATCVGGAILSVHFGLLETWASGDDASSGAPKAPYVASPSQDSRVNLARIAESPKNKPAVLQRSGGITLDVHAASAPNAFGSPSWAGYLVNALAALQNDLATNGNHATDPTGYERAPAVIPPGEIAVTSFNSWRGIVTPPAPFAGEYGNRMHFGLHAYGDGITQFRLEDLTFELHSDDPWDSLVFVGDFLGLGYNGTTRYGVDWGADDAPGGGDDTVYTSGNGMTLVDEIVYVGVGNAWWPCVGGGPGCLPTAQDAMDDFFNWIAGSGPINVTCTYEILTYTGSDSVLIDQVTVDDFGVEGWKSDDTRSSSGTDLVGTNNTHYGKPGQAPTLADDTAIASQLLFVSGPGGVPALELTKSGPGFSKCTLSKVNESGFAADDWRSGFYADYRYYATSATEVAVMKIGVRSPLWGTGVGQSQNGFTAVRSGESAWDLILVDWRGTQPPWTIGAWDRFETDADTQCWRVFRQGTNGFFSATPTPPGLQVGWSLNELYAMSSLGNPAHIARTGYTWSEMLFGTGAKVASIQFGVGSSTGSTTSYIDYVDTSLLNGGARVDFWGPAPVTHYAYPSQVPDEQDPRVVLGDAPNGFEPDAWQNSATGKVNWHARYLADGDYLSRLFPGQAAGLTLNDIASIRYWTKRPTGTAAGRDWWVYIYTRPPGDASWYGKRFINNYNEHTNIGSWIQYSTDNDMTFRRTSGTPTGLMSFDDLQTAYGTELIEMISVQTDSGWSGSFDGYMDGLTITLNNGSVGRVDFVKQPTLTLDADDECYATGETVTVEINMHDVPVNVVGGQYFLQYDESKLDFTSAAPGDSPFTLELYESVNEGLGTIDYSVNAASGDPGASGTATMAVLTFTALSTICTETGLVEWRAHDPPTRLSEPGGQAVYPETIGLDLDDDVDPVFTFCPANITIECDESTLPANTGTATGSDNCDSTPSVTYDDTPAAGGCPQEGTITRTWTVTDDCGNSDSSCVQVITIEDTTDPEIDCPPDATIECDDSILPNDVGVTLSMPFDTNPTLSPTQSPGTWYTDRYPPFGFVSAVFGGGNRLKHSIDASACETCRGGGFNSAFYNTQGRKYDLPAATTRMTIDLYVPSGWATTQRRMAGFWGTGFDSGNAVSAYPIIEFTSTLDGSGVPRFRSYNSNTGLWTDMGLPTGFVYDDWYTLEIERVGNNWEYTVGDLQSSFVETDSVRIANVILQGHNNLAGVTYDIYWDNFAAAQTVQATDNCDNSPAVAYVDVPSLGGCDGTGSIARTWTATDDCGNDASCVQTITVEDTTDPVIGACPANINVVADAGICGAVVTYTAPGATDNCDATPSVVCTPPSGSTFASGTTTVTCTATDDCGNSDDCTFDVTVESVSEMDVTVQLSPTMAAGPFNRCITFEFRNCPSPTLLASSTHLMSFTGGTTGLVTIDVPCGNYDCVTARDRQHTLRRTDEGFGISGTKYVADFTLATPAGDWLIGGNLNDDFWIDILDFGGFSSQWLTHPAPISSCPGSPALHADINSDGVVNNIDFLFIRNNFLQGHEANCCGAAGNVASGMESDNPVERISVRELHRIGLSDLAAGDLNHDGWLDELDIEAFMQGVRPEPVETPTVPQDGKAPAGRDRAVR